MCVLDTHTGDLLRVNPTRRLLPALVYPGNAGLVGSELAPWPAAGVRPIRALLEPPASPEPPEEAEEEHAMGARDAACECRCAVDGVDPDELEPAVESRPASVEDGAPTQPCDGPSDHGYRDDHDATQYAPMPALYNVIGQ